MSKYIVVQKGVVLFGKGETPEDAVADAKEWLDKDSPLQDWEVEDFPTSYHASNPDELVLCQVCEDTKSYLEEA